MIPLFVVAGITLVLAYAIAESFAQGVVSSAVLLVFVVVDLLARRHAGRT